MGLVEMMLLAFNVLQDVLKRFLYFSSALVLDEHYLNNIPSVAINM